MASIPVIAAVVERDGRYLLGRRPAHKRHGGLWEFPGGKMADGEDFLAAADRELTEELAMAATAVGALLDTHSDEGSPYVIHFVEVEAAGDPEPLEHSEVAWFTPADMATLDLAPADARFVDELRRRDRTSARGDA